MEQSKQLIGIKEYVAIILLMVATKLTDDTPAILFDYMGNAGWMAPLINGLLIAVPIFLLIKIITKYQNKGLFEVTENLLGKYITFIIMFLLWIMMFLSLVTDSAIYTDIIGTMYFIRTPTIVIYGILMVVCAYGAKRGFEQIGSVAWTVLPYLQISLLFALILTINKGNTTFIFPLLGPGPWELMKESTLRLSMYAEFLFLFFLYPYIKDEKTFKNGTWIGLSLVSLNIALSMACYIFLFDYNNAMQLNYPYHELIRSISIGFITNMETFFLPFWLIASFVRFSIYLYVTAFLFGKIFQIKHFELVIPTLATLIVFIGLIPESPSVTIFNYNDKILIFSSAFIFFFPCLLWLVALLKGEFKREIKKKVE